MAFGTHSIDATTEFCNACKEVCNDSIDFLKSIDKDKMENHAIELQMLYNQFAGLGEVEKAHYLVSIGKYGIDVLAGSAALKGVNSFRKLKEANRVCTMESMLLSQHNKENLTALAVNQCKRRQAFFNNAKLLVDKQNKHVPISP